MRERDRTAALLYARASLHRQRVRRAQAIVGEALASSPTWYIAISGGKDSTCVLALTREQRPEIPAVTSIYQWMLPETRDYLDRLPNLHLAADAEDHRTGWAPNWPDELAAKAEYPHVVWVSRGMPRLGRSEQGVFLGLRKEEARHRRLHLCRRGALYFCKSHQVWQCNPIADWTVEDVWAYLLSNAVSYNAAYDRLSEIGVPLHRQRIGEFAVEEALTVGQLAILKRGWPAVFNAYAQAHPEARSYA